MGMVEFPLIGMNGNSFIMTLLPIARPDFDVEICIAYASSENFTGHAIYKRPGCYLHEDASKLLSRAIDLAKPLGLRFKIFDAFRPAEAQWVLWNHTPDPDFLSDPRRGSPHSMGVAIDLTLIDSSGDELDMGTGFDDFTPQAHHGALDITVEGQRNRAVLLDLMTAAGWDFFQNEWWHYQMFDARARYPILSDKVLDEPMMLDDI